VTFDRSTVKGRRRTTVSVLLNLELVTEHGRLEADLQAQVAASDSLGSREPPAAQALRDLEARMESEMRPFTLEGIGYGRWQALLMKYPPSREHRRQGAEFDPATFPPAAVAASAVDPELSVDDAEFLMNELDAAQWAKLWSGCLEVNVGQADPPKSLALALHDQMRNGGSSGTAPSVASPPASSSG
jgi:hypothetical protein